MPTIKVAKEDRKLITPEVMGGMINDAKTRQDKAILVFYYVFGTRVSEPFSMMKSDIWIDGNYLYARIPRSKTKGTFPKIDTLKVKTDTSFLHYLVAHWAEISKVIDRLVLEAISAEKNPAKILEEAQSEIEEIERKHS